MTFTDTRVVFYKNGQYGFLGLNGNKNFNEGIKEETLLLGWIQRISRKRRIRYIITIIIKTTIIIIIIKIIVIIIIVRIIIIIIIVFIFISFLRKIHLFSGKSLARSHLVFSSPLIPQKPLFPSSTQSLNRVKVAVHVDFSSWNSSQRRFFCHRILRISRKQDHVANLGQMVFSNSCQVSHFWIT